MTEQDLPEPKPKVYSPVEVQARRWNLVYSFFIFLTAYTFLHKALIPLILKLTTLRDTPYAAMDAWFIHSLLLTYSLRQKKLTRWSAFLAGIAIVYSIHECWQVSLGTYPGWLAISKLLSSIPIAVGSGACLAIYASSVEVVFSWAGALAIFAALVLQHGGSLEKNTVHLPHKFC